MKKCWIVICLALVLSGCAAADTFETVGDDLLQPVIAPVKKLELDLPASAAAPVMSRDDGGKLYLCEGYDLTVQILDGGDMNRTARALCGFSADALTMVETVSDGVKRRDWVWTAAGEGGDHIGRAAVLDDGTYHYCVTVMASAENAGGLEKEWDGVFASLQLG